MAQNDPENAAENSRTDAEKADRNARSSADSAELAHLAGIRSRADASSLPGEEARSEIEKGSADEASQESEVESEIVAHSPPAKSRLSMGRILLGLVALAAIAAAAAFAFRDKDERLRAFAEAVENAVGNPFAVLQQKSAGLAESEKAARSSVAVREAAPVAEAPSAEPPPEKAPPAAEETNVPPKSEATEAKPMEALSEKPAQLPSAVPTPGPSAAPSPGPEAAPALRSEEREALAKRVDQVEQLAQSALKAAEEARAAARAAEAAGKSASEGASSLSERDYLAALEGRIDELASEIKAVREKMEAPKSELRAPQESAEAKSGPSKKGGAAEIVVVAQSLNQAIEKGRPYAVELAALSSLGVDPELLAALEPSAEKGAETPERLLHDFDPVAKRLLSADAPKSTGSYLDHILRSLGRLVRVRPANEAPAATVSDRVEAIRSALKHNDVAGAAAAFDMLPEPAKTDESAFGELLRRRRDAEKASAAILTGAIAALGRNKS